MKGNEGETMAKFVLCLYELEGEDFIAQYELPGMRVEDARQILGQSPGDPMCDTYEVSSKSELERLQRYTDHKIEIGKYAYFVEARQN